MVLVASHLDSLAKSGFPVYSTCHCTRAVAGEVSFDSLSGYGFAKA